MECPNCGRQGDADPDGYNADSPCPDCIAIMLEESRVSRLCTVEEIFEEGFKRGLANAGLCSSHKRQYQQWLLDRV